MAPNDGPVANDDTNSIAEDSALNPINGDLLVNDSDPDTNDSLIVTEVDGVTDSTSHVTGNYGTLIWNTDGTYSYTLDNTDSTVQALGTGETVTESFAYVVSDGNGGSDTAALTITLNGSNDGPAAADDANSVTEDTAPNPITGSVLANDSDVDGDSLSVDSIDGSAANVGTTIAGTYGTLLLHADGSYSYTLDNTHPAVESLDADDSLTESFGYSVTDGHGGSDSATLTITIQGQDESSTPPPNFAFDAFNDEGDGDNSGQSRESVGMEVGGRREILLSRLISHLAPEPILAGYAKPGTILVGRIYSLDGAIIGESTTTVDPAGNWLLQFFGTMTDEQTYVVIEHVATESVETSATNFRLTPDTYRSMQFSTHHDRAATIGTILSDAPFNSLAGEHAENLNPLSLLD